MTDRIALRKREKTHNFNLKISFPMMRKIRQHTGLAPPKNLLLCTAHRRKSESKCNYSIYRFSDLVREILSIFGFRMKWQLDSHQFFFCSFGLVQFLFSSLTSLLVLGFLIACLFFDVLRARNPRQKIAITLFTLTAWMLIVDMPRQSMFEELENCIENLKQISRYSIICW
jgi:hypothetical protein